MSDWITSYMAGFADGAQGYDGQSWRYGRRFDGDAWAEGHRAGLAARKQAQAAAESSYERAADRFANG